MKYIITEEQLKGVNKSIIRLINTEGIFKASEIVGGYDSLKELLGDYEIPKQLKIDTIKNYIDNGGIHLGELDEEPIFYYKDNDGYHNIDYLGYSNAIINVWGGHENLRDMGGYSVRYDKLTSKTLDDIV